MPGTRPTLTPPPTWSFPRPTGHTLSNGIEVLWYQLPGQHVISATLAIDFTLDDEPAGRDGITAMVGRTMTEGTLDHPGEAFGEQLESQGAAMGVDVGGSGIHLVFDVPTTRLATAGPLFAEAVRRTALDDRDVARQVELRLAELAQLRANSAATAGTEFKRAVVDASSRLSRPTGGDAEPVSGLDGHTVRQWYDTIIDASRATMIIGGDLPEDPTAMIEDWFGDWAPGEQPAVTHRSPTPGPRTALIIDRPGSVQADIRLGGWGVDRSDERWAALRVAAYPMGGSFRSRLNRELREAKGYTYGARLGFTPQRHGGWYAMQGSFRTEVVGAALAATRELLDVSRAPLSLDEVTEAQQYHLGSGPLHLSTADEVVDQAAHQVTLGLPNDYLDRNLAAVLAVTPDQATEAFASIVDVDAMSLVVVGDAEALSDSVAEAGWDAQVVPAG